VHVVRCASSLQRSEGAGRGWRRGGHRGAVSTLYDQYMPSVVPPRGRDQTALRRIAAPPAQVAPPPLEVGTKEASRFRPVVSRFPKLNFSEPFLGGDEVNLQCAPSNRTMILTAITAV
jgi:hypothetical protein